MSSPTRIGTRKSPLALAQAEETRARLLHAHPDLAVETVPMMTSGDTFLSQKLADIGGKGLFTKEIDEALLCGDIDLAVHSAKDLPTVLPERLVLACILPREDVRDVLISAHAASLKELPSGARLGTSSLRRSAQALRLRPDLVIVPLRGNVGTRLRKIQAGEADATLLALAGLKRLNMSPLPGMPLSTEEMLPAPAQGAIAIVCREEDAQTQALLAPLNDAVSMAAVLCERALLRALDGSCRTPIAALAELVGVQLRLRACVLSPDGKNYKGTELTGVLQDAQKLGTEAGAILRDAKG